MTGFGEARRQADALAVAVELRSVNSRYFKIALRVGEGYSPLEPRIEELLRQSIKRGTLQVTLRIDRHKLDDELGINAHVLEHYRQQLDELRRQWQLSEPVRLEALLALPGVVREAAPGGEALEEDWPVIRAALEAAVQALQRMRGDEGRAMAADLTTNCTLIARELSEIERRAPEVSESYRTRLSERLSKLLAEYNVGLQPADLVREVGLFAERCDISEETVRLRSHLEQFAAMMALEDSSGRKLDFVTQEMFREANTIGAKANDALISRHVIEIKTAIERMREMIQNVE